MNWVFAIVLFLHVAGAILAFGPTYAFMILGPMGGSEPQHLSFALRVQKKISSTLIAPLAVFQGITGLTLVALAGFEILTRGWLLLSLVLYAILLTIGFGVLIPSLRVLVAATSGPPPAPAPAGGAAPQGPPAHIIAARDRARMGGMINAVLVLVIVFLMVTKPF